MTQVVSAAIVPRLVGMASRRPEAAAVAEAQAMLDASVDALCEVVSRISGDLGVALEAGGVGDMEPACIAADALSTLLGDHCKLKDPSVLSVGAEREMTAVTVLRDAAAASMRRSDVRASLGTGGGVGRGQHHPLVGMTGAVDAADEEEQEEWEEDILTSAVDGIGWIIKGRKEAIVPTFEALLKPVVLPLLMEAEGTDQQPAGPPSSSSLATLPSQKSFGLCMCIDVLEHCGEPGRQSVFPALLPALVQGCTDEVSSTRQACVYGLGVAAEHGGVEFDVTAPAALNLLVSLTQGPDSEVDQNLSVTDNAVSAALRLVFTRLPALAAPFFGGNIALGSETSGSTSMAAVTSCPAYVSLLSALLGKLPLCTDIAEGHDCHRRVVSLAAALDPRVVGGGDAGQLISPLVTALARMIAYQLSSHEQISLMAGAGGFNGGGACGERESEDKLWERQFVDRETREEAERAVAGLRERFPGHFEVAWAGLEEEGKQALQMRTSSIQPHDRRH